MADIQRMTIAITPEELLAAIWYAQGNRSGVPTTETPDSYALDNILEEAERVLITIVAR